MAVKLPLVIGPTGEIEQLQTGDTLNTNIANNQSILVTNANAAAITIGMPVYISAADSVDLAVASGVTTTYAIGLVEDASIDASVTGFVLTDGVLTSADWTTVTGAATLTAGSTYFLDPVTPGMLTTTAPTTAGQFVVRIGTAVSTTMLEVTISRPIKL